MSQAGRRNGRVAFRIACLLGNNVQQHHLGVVLAAETGFRIEQDPGAVIAPDVAFVGTNRYASIEAETKWLPFAPDLAVEVISPNDTFTKAESKAFTWLSAGTRLVLLVDCEAETIHANRSRENIQVCVPNETVDCSDPIPGWHLSVQQGLTLTS